MALVPAADIGFDSSITRVQFTWNSALVATFVLTARIEFYALPGGAGPDPIIRADRALFRDFDLSPALPLAAIANHDSEIESWALDGAAPEPLGAVDVGGFLPPIHFNHDGNRVVFVQSGSAVVAQVAGGLAETFREAVLPAHQNQMAVFIDEAEHLAVLEDPAQARIRLFGTRPDPNIAPTTRAPQQCDQVSCLASSTGAGLLAYCCSDGAVYVREPLQWGPAEVFRGALGGLDAAALSRDGRLLAATERQSVHVWDLQTGEHVTVAAGEAPHDYGNHLAFSPDGRYLGADRHRRVVVWEVVLSGD